MAVRQSTGSPALDQGISSQDCVLQLASLALREPAFATVADAAARTACDALRTEYAAFFEFVSGSQSVWMRSGVGWAEGVSKRTAVPVTDVRPVSGDDSGPWVVPVDAGAERSGAGLLRGHNVRRGLVASVEREGLPFGLLAVYSTTPREFTSDETQMLQSLAAVLSTAATRSLRDQGLRDSEARLAGIIHSAMDAIMAVDDQQRIVLFNHAAELMFRIPSADVIGTSLDRFIPKSVRPAHREHIRRFGDSGTTERRMGKLDPLTGLRSDGEEFPIEASISHAEVGGKRVFTVILRDISERHRLEAQLLHSQKLESVGRLAGGIAHDFNNMLTAIFGYLDLARGCAVTNSPVRECLDAIQLAAERAADLTGKLLAFARKQVIEATVTDLNQLVRGIVGMAGRVLGDDIEVLVHEAPVLPHVRIDRGQFEQVLINLAVNARDAMPKGGKFIIETSSVELDQSYAEVRPDVTPGPYVLLAVSDTGEGMDPVTLEHCFEPFFTTKTKGTKHGSGLGLATCHGIVNQNGGHISVYSEKGRGTTFRIFLPACGEPVEHPVSRHELTAERGSGTILLVEDDALVRGIAVRALRSHGYTVLEAADAEEAMTRAAHANQIDLLLTDVILPGIGGGELAQKLQDARPDLRVLYTSGFTDNMIEQQGVISSGGAFLSKPYTPTTLAAKIRDVLKAEAQGGA